MSISIVELEEKSPSESPGYRFSLSKNTMFSKYGDTISSVTWYIYDTADTATNLASTMKLAQSYDSNGKEWVQCDVQNGTAGKSYYVVGVITCASTRKTAVYGKFTVRDPLA